MSGWCWPGSRRRRDICVSAASVLLYYTVYYTTTYRTTLPHYKPRHSPARHNRIAGGGRPASWAKSGHLCRPPRVRKAFMKKTWWSASIVSCLPYELLFLLSACRMGFSTCELLLLLAMYLVSCLLFSYWSYVLVLLATYILSCLPSELHVLSVPCLVSWFFCELFILCADCLASCLFCQLLILWAASFVSCCSC